MILLCSTGPSVYRFETERSVAGSTTLFNFMKNSDLLIIGFRGHGALVIIRPLGTSIDFSYDTNIVKWRPFEGMFLFGDLDILLHTVVGVNCLLPNLSTFSQTEPVRTQTYVVSSSVCERVVRFGREPTIKINN